MTTTVTITVDLNDLVGLNRATDLFANLAKDANLYADAKKTPDKDDNGGDDNDVVVNAADKFGGKAENPHKTTTTPPPPANTNTSVDVELDSEGLPWDARIHGAAKKKLANDQTWKIIKNIEKNKPGLVAKVKAELRAAMDANPVVTDSSASEDNTTQTPPPPPANTTTPPPPPVESVPTPKYLYEGKEFTADQLRESGWNDDQIAGLPQVEAQAETSMTAITFPELMGKITSALAAETLTQVQVDTALTTEGLASIPLLSARQDLVPKIHAVLFPNG